MEVYEKINQILLNRSMSKRDFASKLRAIEPKLKSTGEVPTEKAIYGYLNGTSNLKIEFIPYIAETLNITEQELFNEATISKKYQITVQNDIKVKEPQAKYQVQENEGIQRLIDLLPYASNTLIKNFTEKLEKIKNI
mgnify:CR=1 FL=1